MSQLFLIINYNVKCFETFINDKINGNYYFFLFDICFLLIGFFPFMNGFLIS